MLSKSNTPTSLTTHLQLQTNPPDSDHCFTLLDSLIDHGGDLPLGRFHHQRLDLKCWFSTFLSLHKTVFTVLWIGAFASVFVWLRNILDGFSIFKRVPAFKKAVLAISKLGKKGGGQPNVPPGRLLTAPFNLTSHMTLFLAEDAEILGRMGGEIAEGKRMGGGGVGLFLGL
ncbi:PREDICTED: probable polygalacturonase [Prunus dulcis]|uniref:PREDICTED: probable polygalacturonase n=1 Tax=Prunus dulcis TaxID=3755 RepID=A0A5E4GJ10_PRUDU|nr:PREDICTED: probable polygalacturonase [Prunus dulcis]